jgi:hypothetical protein
VSYRTIRQSVIACIIVLSGMLGGAAHAAETDQFMTWGEDMKDCSEALNAQLNVELDRFVEKANRRTRPYKDADTFVPAFYMYLSKGLFASRIKDWIMKSDEVDRFPDDSVSYWEYQRKSVYRDPAFPFLLPLLRTIRVGDVYLGLDKVGHFFSFGRRYYQRYQRHVSEGASEEEALERVLKWGVHGERLVVGGFVDGIFSRGDLEANYQGLRLANDLCAEDAPYVVRENGQWRRARDIDLRDYFTPHFDESYNVSRYTGWRKKQVPKHLRNDYCEKWDSPEVQARFERYRKHAPSPSVEYVTEFLEKKGVTPLGEAWVADVCDDKDKNMAKH